MLTTAKQDTQYTKDLEAACDCTIKWQEVSDNAWGQQKSAKMAAGEFPDIGLSLFSMVDAAKYSTCLLYTSPSPRD